MNYSPEQIQSFLEKDQREMFGKAVNSIYMTNPKLNLDEILEMAKKITDKAFSLYSASEDKKERELDFPTE